MRWRNRLRRGGVFLLAAALVGLVSLVPAAAQRPNGAGLVVRHGDGTVLYVYVQFEEETISGEELFYRSGLEVTVAPFGGLGAGVCAINGEGCPADDCWCHSYSSPAYFWHYYALVDGAWVEQLRGPTSRMLRDGDVDGWSWTAGDPGLPATSIDAIALLNGVDRNAPEPTATETATVVPTATDTPPPPEPSATPLLVATPTTTASPPAVATATAASPTPTAAAPRAATATATFEDDPTRTAGAPTATPVAALATAQAPTATRAVTSVAVAVNPSGTVTVLQPASPGEAASPRAYIVFGAMAVAVLAIGVVVATRRHWSRE